MQGFPAHYQRYKNPACERCGFVAVDPLQLDVHHRDHNHHNNHPENLETVCANCHRLEHRRTVLERRRRAAARAEAQS
jgi:5-methylcytosine-specific restriction endonuclease McrA